MPKQEIGEMENDEEQQRKRDGKCGWKINDRQREIDGIKQR